MFFNSKKKIVSIEGMSCKHCALAVSNNLNCLPNVTKVKVDLKKKEAIITYTEKLDDEMITEAIEKLDYKVTGIKDKN